MPYRGTVDGTRILLEAIEPTLRLFRYIMPVPVRGRGRTPSPLGLGLGKDDCEWAVTGVDMAEFGPEPVPDDGRTDVCAPPGETTGGCARWVPLLRESVRSLSWSWTFRLYVST